MKTNRITSPVALLLAAWTLYLPSAALAQEKKNEWPPPVEQALARADKNRPELEKALTTTSADQRKGMAFLIANMPDKDLRSLRADFLLENVDLAYKARKQVVWGKKIPEEIFLNDILPYANVDEARDAWRKELYELCMPLVKDCKTPAEAVQILNSTVFTKLKVKYSTQRKLPNQSPKESIEQGLASCTGLSIVLSDACRSVAIPARLVGTPLWANKRGNHTWVEIWDDGWHFTGACEADPKGLDRGWFVGDAAQAKKDSPEHAIYAASFRKTDVHFPLVWAPNRKDVPAENVTDRYTKTAKPAENRTRMLIRVWEPGQKKRLSLPLTVTDREKTDQVFQGESRGEGADTNDILAFDLLPNREYVLRVGKPVRVENSFKTGAAKQQFVDVEVPAQEKKPAEKKGLTDEQLKRVEKEALAYFSASEEEQAKWKFDEQLDQWLAGNEDAVRRAAWKVYQTAPIHAKMKTDFADNQVRSKDHVSPYTVKEVGKRPPNGWPLVIAMHGGGGVPKQINDDQWKIMQRYYKDQDSVTGYKYLALRAPNDVWNGFYDDYVPPLVINLIRQFLLFGEVDADKVYLIGYSHGGYGAFFIGPKIPDRFAAIHCSAGALTAGTIAPTSLRNTRFTFMIGENDNAYGRRKLCEEFAASIEKLKEQSKSDFPVEMEFKKGFGHGGLPDRDKIKELYPFNRNAVPHHLTWEPTDSVITDFFWLSVPQPKKGQSIDVAIRDNTITITTKDVKQVDLTLDGRLIAFDKPLRITINGKDESRVVRPRFLTLCQSLAKHGDPGLAFTCQIRLDVESK